MANDWGCRHELASGLRLWFHQAYSLPHAADSAVGVAIGSSWFSPEDRKKGSIVPGQLVDLCVLSADYFSIPEDEIKRLESVLTIVGGKMVYATYPFSKLAPPPLHVSPDWSPVKTYSGYARGNEAIQTQAAHLRAHQLAHSMSARFRKWAQSSSPWSLSCDCLGFV